LRRLTFADSRLGAPNIPPDPSGPHRGVELPLLLPVVPKAATERLVLTPYDSQAQAARPIKPHPLGRRHRRLADRHRRCRCWRAVTPKKSTGAPARNSDEQSGETQFSRPARTAPGMARRAAVPLDMVRIEVHPPAARPKRSPMPVRADRCGLIGAAPYLCRPSAAAYPNAPCSRWLDKALSGREVVCWTPARLAADRVVCVHLRRLGKSGSSTNSNKIPPVANTSAAP